MRAAKRSEPMRTFLALILALVSIPTAAQSEDGPRPGKILSPYFLVDGATPGVESFPLKSTDVVANISGVIADVTVTQIYENRGATPIHAKSVYPTVVGPCYSNAPEAAAPEDTKWVKSP